MKKILEFIFGDWLIITIVPFDLEDNREEVIVSEYHHEVLKRGVYERVTRLSERSC